LGVHLYDDRIEAFPGGALVVTHARARERDANLCGGAQRVQVINSHHVIHALRRKPIRRRRTCSARGPVEFDPPRQFGPPDKIRRPFPCRSGGIRAGRAGHAPLAARHLNEAQLPAGKTLATFDFKALPILHRARVEALAAGDWVDGDWLDGGGNLIASHCPAVHVYMHERGEFRPGSY